MTNVSCLSFHFWPQPNPGQSSSVSSFYLAFFGRSCLTLTLLFSPLASLHFIWTVLLVDSLCTPGTRWARFLVYHPVTGRPPLKALQRSWLSLTCRKSWGFVLKTSILNLKLFFGVKEQPHGFCTLSIISFHRCPLMLYSSLIPPLCNSLYIFICVLKCL